MALDKSTLIRAETGINCVTSCDLSFEFDVERQLLHTKLKLSFTDSQKRRVLDPLHKIDEAIRNFTDEKDFVGVARFVEFVPLNHFPNKLSLQDQRSIKTSEQVFIAQITDKKVIRLLSRLGYYCLNKEIFATMLSLYFRLNRNAPSIRSDRNDFILHTAGRDFEPIPTLYLRKSPDNERLLENREFFEVSGLTISEYTDPEEETESFRDYFRITCADFQDFQIKCSRLLTLEFDRLSNKPDTSLFFEKAKPAALPPQTGKIDPSAPQPKAP